MQITERKEQRELLDEGQLGPTEGLVGDNWHMRGAADPDACSSR